MSADDLANAVLELERAWNADASDAQLGEHIGHCARLARALIAEDSDTPGARKAVKGTT